MANVSDVMSTNPQVVQPQDSLRRAAEQDTEEVLRVMGDKQVRRLPVIDTDRRLVGIVALADLALRQSGHIDKAMREISQPEDGSGPPGGGVLSGGGAGTSPGDAAPH